MRIYRSHYISKYDQTPRATIVRCCLIITVCHNRHARLKRGQTEVHNCCIPFIIFIFISRSCGLFGKLLLLILMTMKKSLVVLTRYGNTNGKRKRIIELKRKGNKVKLLAHVWSLTRWLFPLCRLSKTTETNSLLINWKI